MRLTAGQDELMQYFGVIRNGQAAGLSTADLWSAVHGEAAARGEQLVVADAIDMGRLRSVARALDQAASALNTAHPDTPLTVGTFMPEAPWARDVVEQGLAPAWQINYQVTVTDEQGSRQVWRSDFIDLSLPTTVGDLRRLIEESASITASTYGETMQSLDAIEGMSV